MHHVKVLMGSWIIGHGMICFTVKVTPFLVSFTPNPIVMIVRWQYPLIQQHVTTRFCCCPIHSIEAWVSWQDLLSCPSWSNCMLHHLFPVTQLRSQLTRPAQLICISDERHSRAICYWGLSQLTRPAQPPPLVRLRGRSRVPVLPGSNFSPRLGSL